MRRLAIRRLEAADACDINARLAIDGAHMAEGFEAVLPIVIAHSRRPDAAKGQVFHRIVEDDVIHRHTTGNGA